MSTKTTFKRIALVAVAALGFGLLSAAPSNADDIASSGVSSISLTNTTAAPKVGSAVEVNMGALIADLAAVAADGDTIKFIGYLSTYPSSGFAQVTASATAVGTDIDALEDANDGETAEAASGATYTVTLTDASDADYTNDGASSATTGLAKFSFTPAVAGTYVLTVFHDADAANGAVSIGEAVQTISIVVGAATAFSTGTSSAYMIMGNTTAVGTATSDAIPASGPAAKATANRGAITVSLNNAEGSAMASGNSINVDVTGAGYVVWSTANAPIVATGTASCAENPTFSASVGRSLRAQTADAVGTLYICADGSVGSSTIVISVTDATEKTTVLSTKTFVFYGSVAKLEVSSATYTHGRAGGYKMGQGIAARTAARNLINPTTNATDDAAGTSLPAFIVKATDSAGNPATAGSAPAIVSSDVSVVASGNCVLDTYVALASSGNGYGFYNCDFTTAAASKSGDKATLTIRIVDPLDATKFITTTLAITIGGSRSTDTLALDKATYDAGSPMIVTRSAKDSAGNPAHDGATAPEVLFSKSIGGSAQTVAASWYTQGTVATSSTRPTVFAPGVAGAFEARMTGVVAGATSAIVATATVGDDAATAAASAAADAAAEATDAANAATDAANAAAEAADAATAAAQDAADAVAALSTSVTAMVDTLRKQITSLTNLVIKIQKKVRA